MILAVRSGPQYGPVRGTVRSVRGSVGVVVRFGVRTLGSDFGVGLWGRTLGGLHNLNVRSYINREFLSGESVLQNNTGITNKIGRDFTTERFSPKAIDYAPLSKALGNEHYLYTRSTKITRRKRRDGSVIQRHGKTLMDITGSPRRIADHISCNNWSSPEVDTTLSHSIRK